MYTVVHYGRMWWVMGDGYDYVMGDGMGDSVYQVMGTTRIGHWYYGVTLEE